MFDKAYFDAGVKRIGTDCEKWDGMIAAFGGGVRPFIRQVGSKFHLDLKQINALSLSRAGVRHIDISCDCTKCQPNRFWSHRVTGNIRGSQGAIISCKEERK